MAEHIKAGCALHGAIRTVLAIGGLVPIVHSNTGCAMQGAIANRAAGTLFVHDGMEIPTTAVIERHVVFGGASRLREQIKNTIKVVEGEAYIVLDGCEAEMVGDDSEAMVKEAVVQQAEKVFSCKTAGFHGSAHKGYESVMVDIIRALPVLGVQEDPRKTVNVFGILPGTDVFWRGDLEEIARLFAGIGLHANVFFGPGGFDEVKRAPSAALSLVFSEWGLIPARELKAVYGVPVLEFEAPPIGYDDVEAGLRTVGQKLKLDSRVIESFLQKEKERFYGYLETAADAYYEEQVSRNAAIIADEAPGKAIAGFLERHLAAKVVLRDSVAKNVESSGAGIIIGSAQEAQEARALGIPLLGAAYPVNGVIMNKTYMGISGSLRLTEDYIGVIAAHNRVRQAEVIKKIRE
ncbi:MAG TPA: nitrogenase component 1 [Negativicutes bacterium]|nr:nitrogenase component 1 [Negativicutes bacterium]